MPVGVVEKKMRPPPEMVKNVQGSASAAGSGEFHVYKHSRRREYERLKMMETKDKAVSLHSVPRRIVKAKYRDLWTDGRALR